MITNREIIMRGVLRHRSGFTLVEMIIVIGIIGVLTAILLGQFSGATESARATECLTHLRNLAMAVQNCGMTEDYYPSAGDNEYARIHGTDIGYHVHKGFITRYASPNPYAGDTGASSHQSPDVISTYGTDENAEKRIYCVTNSAIWGYGAKKLDEFVCPSHKRSIVKKGKSEPAWSYAMNSYFGYDWSQGKDTTAGIYRSVKYANCKRPDRRLLFAELPWNEDTNPKGAALPYSEKPGDPRYDGVLQFDDREGGNVWSGESEWIGINHKSSRTAFAHICFVDGHTEKLAFPLKKDGTPIAGKQDVVNLTAWLCQADDIQQNGGRWERTHKTKDE